VRIFSNLVDAYNFLYSEWEYSREDPWGVQSSAYEHGKLLQQFVLVGDRHYNRVLDVGCGAGFFTGCLAKISKEVIGLDRSPGALRQARAVLQDVANVSLAEGNIRSYPLSPSDFDLIVLGEVLYYLAYLSGDGRFGNRLGLQALLPLAGKLRDALVPGGRLLLTSYFNGPQDDLTRSDMEAFRRLFEEAGLTLETEYEGILTRGSNLQQYRIFLFQKPGPAA
jgi:SAM-dependent methyltransferase